MNGERSRRKFREHINRHRQMILETHQKWSISETGIWLLETKTEQNKTEIEIVNELTELYTEIFGEPFIPDHPERR